MPGLTAAHLAFLDRFGFDRELFARWQTDVRSGRLSRAANAVRGPLLPPPTGTVVPLPPAGSPARTELASAGAAALRRGELGVVVLNGGMATRFGGVVKGVVPVLGPQRSFLGLVAEDIRRAERQYGGTVHLLLMNSFATDDATQEHLHEHRFFGLDPRQVHCFNQFVAVRMHKDGSLFVQADGDISPYGPGHGDFAGAIRRHGHLRRFLDSGGRWLMVRNVDNVGARISAAVLGHHLASGAELTVEVTPKRAADVGGSPFAHEGVTQLVEQIRYPAGFDPDIVPVFNTNTFTFSAAALEAEFPLGWYYVEKQVEGRTVVQIEHLIGEMTRFLRTNFLEVGRAGSDNRFLPVKQPEDLVQAREEIAALYAG